MPSKKKQYRKRKPGDEFEVRIKQREHRGDLVLVRIGPSGSAYTKRILEDVPPYRTKARRRKRR